MSADARVRSFVDRILRLKQEQDDLAKDIRDIYAEAKGEGYNKTAMGEVVAHLRRVEKKGEDAVRSALSDFDLYLDAYERATGTKVAIAHTHEKSEMPPAERSTARVEAGKSDGDRNPVDVALVTAGETAPTLPSDGDAFVAVKGHARLANVEDVEPSPSGPIPPSSAPTSSPAETKATGTTPLVPVATLQHGALA